MNIDENNDPEIRSRVHIGNPGLMPSIVEVRPFEADLGAAKATGSLFITDPIEGRLLRDLRSSNEPWPHTPHRRLQ